MKNKFTDLSFVVKIGVLCSLLLLGKLSPHHSSSQQSLTNRVLVADTTAKLPAAKEVFVKVISH